MTRQSALCSKTHKQCLLTCHKCRQNRKLYKGRAACQLALRAYGAVDQKMQKSVVFVISCGCSFAATEFDKVHCVQTHASNASFDPSSTDSACLAFPLLPDSCWEPWLCPGVLSHLGCRSRCCFGATACSSSHGYMQVLGAEGL